MTKLNFKNILVLIFTLATYSFCEDFNSKIIIPIDLSSGRPVINLMIDKSGPYKFIFDTGSSGNVIDSDLAKELELKVVGQAQCGAPGSANVITSDRVNAPRVSIYETDIIKETTFIAEELRTMIQVDGVLSLNFFSEFLVTLDYANSKLILTDGHLNPEDLDVIQFGHENRIINLDVIVDGNKVAAHLDSGNPGGIDIPYSMKDKLSFKTDLSEAGIIRTPADSFKIWRAELNGDVAIGNVIFSDPKVSLVEDFLFVNLGYNIFKDLKVTIDQNNKLIKFEKSVPN